MAATLRAISQLCAAHGIPLASHDDDTVDKVALMQALGATISEFPVTAEAAAEARALGLTDRGAIAPGLLADLVIADDSGIGHVRATIRGGRKVFSDGSLTLATAA
ncbi:MAG: hypothetical protein IE927_13740 [Rhodobacterales bacterium]|nr:hypothetical protein [Rhodobacterales bacterium]